MPRRSFRDPITQVLKCHGFVETNEPGDLSRIEPDDFALELGRWQWNGTAWVPFGPLPTPPSALATALDAVVTSTGLPSLAQIKAIFQIWRQQVH